jgi:AcrR family transcriptional regulator
LPVPSAPKRPSTKELLMTTGERLFGRFGIDGVSLREIGAAAGQTNSSVVQYHFKDKDGLVVAILNGRLRSLEPLRGEHLDRLTADGGTEARELLRALWAPMASIRGADGEPSFCRFLLQYVLQTQGPDHPSRASAPYRRGQGIPAELPQLARLHRLLRRQYRHLSDSDFGDRLRAVGLMFLSTIVEHGQTRLLAPAGRHPEFNFELILDMAIAALATSPRK